MRQDLYFHKFLLLVGLLAPLLFLGLVLLLGYHSLPVIKEIGLDYIFGVEWNPLGYEFGALPFIQGTLLTSLLALFFAVPFCLAAALSINLLLPNKLAIILRSLFEVLASIPSIIYGQWALLVLVPLVRDDIVYVLQAHPVFSEFRIFQGMSFGLSILTASLVLSLMISPIITSLMIEIFKMVPVTQKQGFLSLGTTYWEMIYYTHLKPNIGGMLAASSLGLSRALGETMAVAMVIGNYPTLSFSLVSPSSTIASILANEYAEVTDPIHLSALVGLALALFLLTFLMNFFSRLILRMGNGP